MIGAPALARLALADFRDRVRRRSFLAVLAAAAFLGLEAIRGHILVAVGHYTGEPSSAWAGSLMAIVAATFVSLAGFWTVKGSIARDRATGVGEILAATPLARASYTLAKAASHFLVLAAMVGILALAAVALLWVEPASGPIEPIAILAPLVLFSLPMMALVAALAVLFETVPGLGRGFGNFLWFFVWAALLTLPLETRTLDFLGIATFQREMGAVVRGLDPTYDNAFAITLSGDNAVRVTERFRWNGLPAEEIPWLERAEVVGLAVLIALAAALPFDRFDPANRRTRRSKKAPESQLPNERLSAGVVTGGSIAALDSLAPTDRSWGISGLMLAELRVALAALPRWWRLGALTLGIAGLLAPATARQGLLAASFFWPALLWSGLAVRDKETGVEAILAAAPRARTRQLAATLGAGWLAGLVTIGGVALRTFAAGEVAWGVAILAGAAAMPVAAVALGLLSRTSRLFEGLFVAAWYLGPLQRVTAFDFAGATAAGVAAGTPWRFLLLGMMLLVAALAVERWRAVDASARFG